MSSDLKSVFIMNEAVRILKHRREKNMSRDINDESLLSVRRKLFDTPDSVMVEDCLKREFSNMEERKKDTWDFDFVKGCPKESASRFAWEPVSARSRLNILKSRKTVQKRITDYLGKRKIYARERGPMKAEDLPMASGDQENHLLAKRNFAQDQE